MYHRNYTTYLQKELDFLKLLVARFHEQEKVNGLELDVALSKMQEIYEQLLQIKFVPEAETDKDKDKLPKAEKPAAVVTENKEDKSTPVCEEKKQPDCSSIAESVKISILAEKIGPSDFHPINETLAQKMPGNDLSSKLQTAPLNAINAGIGLNEQFLYIRELFKGDSDLYNNTIRYLDSAESLDDAMDFIHRNFDWDKTNETTQKFISLVYRRHSSS